MSTDKTSVAQNVTITSAQSGPDTLTLGESYYIKAKLTGRKRSGYVGINLKGMTSVVKGTANAIRFQLVSDQDILDLQAKIDEHSHLGEFYAINVKNIRGPYEPVELNF